MQYNSTFILSTRPLNDALVQKAAENNLVVETMSLIETQPVTDEALRAKIISLASQSVPVAITSINAAKSVIAYLQGHSTAWQIFTIGTATQNYVSTRFGADRIAGVAENASSLVTLIIAARLKELVYFCGDKRRDELPEALDASRVKWEEIVVYKTIYSSRKTDKTYAGVLFFSPGAVQSFFADNKVAPETVMFAIGSTTAACIRTYSSNAVVVSETPSAEALVEKAIIHFFLTKTHHERTQE